MLIKVSELQGSALDWAVAKCEGKEQFFSLTVPKNVENCFSHFPYSTDWSYGGPIIEREEIGIDSSPAMRTGGGKWIAVLDGYVMDMLLIDGPTPLIAAMRCYVASRLGGEIEVPDELA
jgi:hypothetical protein